MIAATVGFFAASVAADHHQVLTDWFSNGYIQIFILYAIGHLRLKDYGSATLLCKI